jgi:hypothetical protein
MRSYSNSNALQPRDSASASRTSSPRLLHAASRIQSLVRPWGGCCTIALPTQIHPHNVARISALRGAFARLARAPEHGSDSRNRVILRFPRGCLRLWGGDLHFGASVEVESFRPGGPFFELRALCPPKITGKKIQGKIPSHRLPARGVWRKQLNLLRYWVRFHIWIQSTALCVLCPLPP